MRRRSLVGTMARTAVIAGTATAVSGNVAMKQQERVQAQAQQSAAQQAAFDTQQQVAQMQSQMAAMQAQQATAAIPAAPAVTAPVGAPDITTQLQQLAALKTAGILSDAEFEAAKARVLNG